MDDEEVLVQHYSFIQGDMVDRNRQPEDSIMMRRSMTNAKDSSVSKEEEHEEDQDEVEQYESEKEYEEDQGEEEEKGSPTSHNKGTVNYMNYY